MNGLIYDLAETREFVEKILRKLENDEVYILLLNARKKWCPDLSRSEEIMYRDVIRDNDPDRILRKIRKTSCVSRGIYVDLKTNKEVDINCMAIYVVLDPRSTLKGYGEFIENINGWIYESFMGGVGGVKNLELYRRMDIKLFSAIHKHRSRGLYFVIDIDKKDEDILYKITEPLVGNIRWISETNGGFHVIVDRSYETGMIIFPRMVEIEYVEILKDPTTPVAGTLHGGFPVKGIRRDLWN